ncbi:conserved hypothetical protein [Arthrobacter sp. Hiyo4]|nr:conserved hypothetical protein [Arthrobacter sp. Hiyo4]
MHRSCRGGSHSRTFRLRRQPRNHHNHSGGHQPCRHVRWLPTAAAAVDLKTASSSAGNIVVDAAGMSVYFFTKDVKDSGTSACTGACLTAWPPLLTTAAKPAAEGITGTLGTITTPDGAKQVTLNGLPLYYFAQDKKPGDVLGQGVNNVWYLATPAGEMIRKAASGY